MAYTDELKNFRNKGYPPKDNKETGMDSGTPHSTPRTIALTDDEQKYFTNANPGEDVQCIVHGTYEDGKIRVMGVQPTGEGYGQGMEGEDEMAKKVAMRVSPTTMPSPS